MNENNTKKLLAGFPRLYRRDKNDPGLLIDWGFQCGDGWYSLIWNLSEAVEEEARKLGLDPESTAWPRVVQVKEKFGTLRFYLRTPELSLGDAPAPKGFMEFRPISSIESIRELVRVAEKQSAEICESCGQPGTLRQAAWWHVKCDSCEAEYLEMKRKRDEQN